MPFRLNYHHLRYFWAVAQEGHLTRAAKQLHISQSALSAQIRQLEDQIGQPLFLRDGRTLQLTETGRVVFSYAEDIFSLGGELVDTLKGGKGAHERRLRIGNVATLSRNFLENFLRPVIGVKDLHLVLQSGSLTEMLDHLHHHRLDVVLSNQPVSRDSDHAWRCIRLARQPVCLVGPPRKLRRAFRWPDDIAGHKLIVPGASSDIRAQFDILCAAEGIEPHIHAEVDDMAMLRLLARDSGGIALIPEVVVQDEIRNGVLTRYCELSEVHENFYAIYLERKFPSPFLQTLLQAAEAAPPPSPDG